MIYRTYIKNQKIINIFLLVILLFCVLIYSVQDIDLRSLFAGSDINETSTVFRNLFYILAIIFTGFWSYYAFFRKRTFIPSISINIHLKDFCGENNEVAIIRFTVKNIGNVKVSPLRGRASFQHGTLKNGKMVFSQKEELEDIFEHYHEIDQNLFLEPGDDVNIDRPYICKMSRNKNPSIIHALFVKSEFWAARNRTYQEIAIFNISPKTEVKK